MRAATLPLISLLCLLLVSHLNGQYTRSRKCLCADKGARIVKEIKSFKVFPENHSCHRVEIQVVTASGKLCLDPTSRRGLRILSQNKLEQENSTSNGHVTA